VLKLFGALFFLNLPIDRCWVLVSLQLRNTVEELKENKKAAGNAKVPFAARCLLFSALLGRLLLSFSLLAGR